MLAKTAALEMDEIVVDLEDSVAPDAKEQARELVGGFLATEQTVAVAVAVRINPLSGQWGERDVIELVEQVGPRIGSLVIPKVESAEDVLAVDRLLGSVGEPASGVGLQALVETAGGLLRAGGLREPDMLADELSLLLEGARVSAQSVASDDLGPRLVRMGEAMIAAHAAK